LLSSSYSGEYITCGLEEFPVKQEGRKGVSSFLPLGCVSGTVACSELQEINVARQRSTVRRKEQKGSSMIHFGRRYHDAIDRRFPGKTHNR